MKKAVNKASPLLRIMPFFSGTASALLPIPHGPEQPTNIHRVPKKGSHQTFANNFLKS